MTLDEYIDLKAKVETRMKIVDMTATGDDNILSEEEKTDLEYRKAQLRRLQEEVVDIEEMSSGISIMDLGLNEFRLDLLDYMKEHPDIEHAPFGLHSVTVSAPDMPAGVIFVLKNRSGSVNIDNQNRLHPFYMVYISKEGHIVCDHLSPKQMLDKMRYLCKGKMQPIPELYRAFNKETQDGRNMAGLSRLLGDAIASIIQVKEESDISSFLGGEQISFLENTIQGLDDFELICFLVVRDEPQKTGKKDTFRLVIAGSRNFEDYPVLENAVDAFLKQLAPKRPVTIVSGTARGADRLGEQYARQKGYVLEEYPANWHYFGKAAAVKRNAQMAAIADAAIVFWDGQSAGAKNMMECAEARGIPCQVIRF